MALEVPVYLNDLVVANPADGDTANYGAAHLRNLKTALKNSILNSTKPFGTPLFVSKNIDYTVLVTDDGARILVDASGGNRIITLPAIASVWNGFRVLVKKVDSTTNTVTVQRAGADTIDGGSSVVLSAQYSLAEVSTNLSVWSVLSSAVRSQVFEDNLFINAAIVTTYNYALGRSFGGTFNTLTAKLASGTCTVQLLIGGVVVTGSNLAVTSVKQTATCSAANTWTAGQDIALQVTAISSPSQLSITNKYTRTLS
jgi:hypothetical protein